MHLTRRFGIAKLVQLGLGEAIQDLATGSAMQIDEARPLAR